MSFLNDIIDAHQNLIDDNIDHEYMENIDNLPTEVIIKEGQFDTSLIKEYTGEGLKQFEFRPQTFNQFIGQPEAKERAKTIIKKAQRGLKAHFLIDGIRGHGKTVYCELLAKELNAHILKRTGNQVNINNMVDIINEINMSTNPYVILFIDEIETMDKKLFKTFNPIIESFEIAGKRIKKFIFAGATINKHILLKNNPDTLDRIYTHIKFIRYTDDEITQIINQYVKELYHNEQIEKDTIIAISRNCKYNPRTAIALLEDYIVEKDIYKVLKTWHIVINGLNNKDIQILQILHKSKKPMGANALAMRCGLTQQEYIREFEPYLVEYDYINRVPSRVITEKGKELIITINKRGKND